ncbi:helix-turn-helix transcriptional regulator, partial [Streptomyces sp. NPDC001795]|uniref:helix-turn-helix domain-containing protein n=1 Tax=Streptomyces sp. NPDC001795 TaxID=3154525 RepID=UPI0033292BB4
TSAISPGVTPPQRHPSPTDTPLTNEADQALLAATGATNRDIVAHLLLSPRTIGQHLYKAFPKLGVSSRTEPARLDLDRFQQERLTW